MTLATSHSPPPTTTRFATIYAATWVVLAAASLGYLTTLAFQPNWLGAWVPPSSTGPIAAGSGDGQPSVARFATDITGLRQSVDVIKRDVADLKTEVTASVSRDQELAERLAAVEERHKVAVAETVNVVSPKTAVQRQAEAKAQKQAERAAAAQVVASTTPAAAATTPAEGAAVAPSAKFTVLNAPAPQQLTAQTLSPATPIATGSLPPPAQGVPGPSPVGSTITFGPATIKAPQLPSGVELSTGPSLDALRLNWNLLFERHGASLKNLEPRYMNAGDGQPYQLVAGPISSPEEAARVCSQLRTKRVACRVTGFGGNAL